MAILRVYTPCFARSVTRIPGGMKMGIWMDLGFKKWGFVFLKFLEQV
jgi:hypothetical protein